MLKLLAIAASLLALTSCGGSETQSPPASGQVGPSPTPTPSPTPSPAETLGLFVLSPVGQTADASYLSHPSLSGIVVRQEWSAIAQSADLATNNYSFLLSEADRAGASGKKMSVIVNWAGKAAPVWLKDRNVNFFEFINPNEFQPDAGQLVSSPATWDPDYVTEVEAFIADLGSRISSKPAIAIVNTHCVSASTPDWFLPINSDENIAIIKAAGYTNEAMLASCKRIIDATMQAFPNQVVTMAFGQLPAKLTGETAGDFLARQVLDHVRTRWPNRQFLAMRWNLGATTPDPRTSGSLTQGWALILEQLTNTQDRILPSAQWVWPASDVQSCRANGQNKPCDAVTNLTVAGDIASLGYRMPYLEVYGADVGNPELGNALARLAAQMPPAN